MAEAPCFPEFKPLTLEDRTIIQPLLRDYQPETSELTFTNLFIWKDHYGFHWSLKGDCLLLVSLTDAGAWAYPPVGTAPRTAPVAQLLSWLKEVKGETEPRIERADARLVAELAGTSGLGIEPVREHFDYVYRTEDLVNLAGGKYHAKRNHLNSFRQTYRFVYTPLTPEHLPACLKMAEAWCRSKRCQEDLNLMGEWQAVQAALHHFEELELTGGVILMDWRVEAFTVGEMLNRKTAVVHIEKANPDIRGLYTLINQQFCENAWAATTLINREQDLGEAGLRTAKLSYHPHRLVEKYRIKSM